MDTKYVVFVDNDIHYEAGWLEALEENAERNRSSVVAPLICIGPPTAATIHHAGGILFAEGDPEHPTVSERHRLMDKPMGEFNPLTAPEKNEIAEFHCLLMRRDVLDEIGFFDERLVTREQIDLALRLKIAGKTVTFEENAVVTYMRAGRQSQADLDYFLQRWDHSLVLKSLSIFESTWDVTLDKERILYDWIARHRVRAIGEHAPLALRLLGERRFRKFAVPFHETRSRKRWPRPGSDFQDPITPPAPLPEERSKVFGELVTRTEPVEGILPADIPTTPLAVKENLETIAGMATMPTRSETVIAALESILPQIDRLYLFLDGFSDIPRFADHPRIVPLLSSKQGDLKANGKFLGLTLHPNECFYFSIDDDIVYPNDYVSSMRKILKRYKFGAVAGVHGSAMNRTINSYLQDRVVVHRSSSIDHDFIADVLGTCSTAFATQCLRFDVRKWTKTNVVDLSLARLARERNIPLVGVARRENWLTCLAEAQPDSIYTALQRDDQQQTLFARDLFDPQTQAANSAKEQVL